jgi:hypothetical protein
MINPVSIPSAAAISYGDGDVRHFGEGDAMDVPGMSNPTRHLADRDVILAKKLNEVIADVNNKEQYVPMPILRTTLPPNAEEIIQNFRIPPNFECRVLNATVTSLPASASAELDIYYASNSYGNSTGTQIVSTSTEYTGGTTFFSSGELVITLKNRGGSTLEMIASVLLTLRPIGSTSSYLLTSATAAPAGPPGQRGLQGVPGVAGPAGSQGSPGLVWRDTWSNSPGIYADKDVVFYQGSSWKATAATVATDIPGSAPSKWTLVAKEGDPGFNWRGDYSDAIAYAVNDAVYYPPNGNSYVCVAIATGLNPPANPSKWGIIAKAGANGLNYRGVWTNVPSPVYAQGDVVNIAVSPGVYQTYVATSTGVSAIPPAGDWSALFSSPANGFSVKSASGTIYTESDFSLLSTSGPYTSVASGTTWPVFTEITVGDATSGRGMRVLKFNQYARWLGSITLKLPSVTGLSDAASTNWQVSDVVLSTNNPGAGSPSADTSRTLQSSGTVSTVQASTNQGFGVTSYGTITSSSFVQSGNKVTITNPVGSATNSYLALIGFSVYAPAP